MSRTEYHIGKLTEIDLKGKTIDQFAKELSGKETYASYYDNWLEFFNDEYRKTHYYHVASGKLYSIEDRELDEHSEIIKARRLSPDSIEYELKWYNGGAGMEECMDEALDQLKKEEDGKSI
tara:strand:+ start:40306 stop:40668 length:363 start_codon:yes stop_codon:yes gene_type:complete